MCRSSIKLNPVLISRRLNRVTYEHGSIIDTDDARGEVDLPLGVCTDRGEEKAQKHLWLFHKHKYLSDCKSSKG